jgi:glyoxylase-like metal-dependent hydrolase (beta-lactamase superfamily II)
MNPHTDLVSFHDRDTGTITHLVWDRATRQAAVIDPVLDFDAKAGRTHTPSAERVAQAVRERHLTLQWLLETHAHADHLSAARWLQSQLGGRIAIGARIREVQATFKKIYNLERGFLPDGSQFDHLMQDGERFMIGGVEATALPVPGHTPADMAYLIDGQVFVGDTLFMPDVGTSRTDFPGGDARTLYRSIHRLLKLPPETAMLVCHDYPPAGRDAAWRTSVAEQRAHNIHVHDGVDEAAFVAMRQARDATLDVPQLILPSIQVNVRAGALPPPEDDGVSYLKIPLNVIGRGTSG